MCPKLYRDEMYNKYVFLERSNHLYYMSLSLRESYLIMARYVLRVSAVVNRFLCPIEVNLVSGQVCS